MNVRKVVQCKCERKEIMYYKYETKYTALWTWQRTLWIAKNISRPAEKGERTSYSLTDPTIDQLASDFNVET